MAKAYQIISQQPFTYLQGGFPVNGFLVRAELMEFNEVIEAYVPKLDPKLVNDALMEKVTNRRILEDLGNEE